MWCGGDDGDARFADRNGPEAMLERHTGIGPTVMGLREYALDFANRHLVVRGVLDSRDIVIGAHGSQKDARAAALRALDFAEQ